MSALRGLQAISTQASLRWPAPSRWIPRAKVHLNYALQSFASQGSLGGHFDVDGKLVFDLHFAKESAVGLDAKL